ncbi:FKBP-type peptidyl-prolyl cis-trans isomerase [bacterium]|nr:FKBP-type peptidyl-prolyl cis-trans isomerase [bacterium]MBU1025035.1 FKBP-type peptidyl-prolyl cis-trans isomerase [bacterium]
MAKAKNGDTVRVHYKGTLDDGTEFDNSDGREPLEFILGIGQVISGFDKAVEGMEIDESKRFTIPCEEAYGQYNDGKVFQLNFDTMPEDFEPEIGERVQANDTEGKVITGTVIEIQESSIIVDDNHPLAGQDLTLAVKLIDIL